MKQALAILAWVAAWATLGSTSPAQDAKGPDPKALLQPEPGQEALLGSLTEGRPSGKDANRLTDLRYGKKPVLDPNKLEADENRRVLALAAKWYVFRFTHPGFHGQGETTMHDLMQENLRALLLVPTEIRKRGLNPEQEIYLQELCKEMIPCCREVLKKNSKPIVRINVARTLAAIAETGPFPNQEEVADTLVDILHNPKESDAVKLYALRGLRELFAQGGGRSIIKDEKRELRAILAIHQFLERKPELPANAREDELDGFRYVRREALRALGQTRYPTVPKAKDQEGQTARLLLRYARKDGITPEPSLAEQVEAAIGICQLQPGLDKGFNVDYAANHVGAVVVEFANQYARGGLLPWKLTSARLGIGLEQFKAGALAAANAKAADYAAQMVDRAREVIKPIDADKEVNPLPLDTWLRSTPPPSGSVYSTDKDSVIRPGK